MKHVLMAGLLSVMALVSSPSFAAPAVKRLEQKAQPTEPVPILKKYNITADPLLGLATGAVDMHMEFGVLEDLTVGPVLGYLTKSGGEISTTGFEIGARANEYLSGERFKTGWVLSSLLTYGYANYELTSIGESISASGLILGAVAGHHWFFPASGWNVGLGAGPMYYTASAKMAGAGESVPFEGLQFSLEGTLGFSF